MTSSPIEHWKALLASRQKTEQELRSRVIAHHKAGERAPRLTRAYGRWKGLVAQAKRGLRRVQDETGPHKAIAWAIKRVGITENPPGSNSNPQNISIWQRAIAGGLTYLVHQPWCGVFLGMALKAAGVVITARVASVRAIEEDARAGRNGFERLVPISEARPGDAAIMFGAGVHVELIESVNRESGTLTNIGGNTSFSNSGSQSNGGAVARRTRLFSQVHAVARPAYPK